ncbi:hypothetical protein [Haloferax mucosum]|uniref:hypothetical protein n=1 Tax=Haloferax mucosum TaxID=403181 RepID=UPI0012670FB1|nr:hypothetical protein [Haloferax mucosum]
MTLERAYATSKAQTMVAVDAATGDLVWPRLLSSIDAADHTLVIFSRVSAYERLTLSWLLRT